MKRSATSFFALTEVAHFVLALLRERASSCLVAVLSFSLLIASLLTFFDGRIERRGNAVLQEIGISQSVFAERTNHWLSSLREHDAERFLLTVLQGGVPPETSLLAATYVRAVAPLILIEWCVVLLVLFVAKIFFYLLFMQAKEHPFTLFVRLPWMCVRMMALSLLVLLRSFVWVPIIGLPLGMYFLPRLCLALPIHAEGRQRLLESLSWSLQRTRGRWFSALSCLLALIACSFAILWLALVFGSIVALFTMKLGFLLWLVGIVGMLSFACAFEVGMAGHFSTSSLQPKDISRS